MIFIWAYSLVVKFRSPKPTSLVRVQVGPHMTLGLATEVVRPFVILEHVDEKAGGREAVSTTVRALPEARARGPEYKEA